MINQGTGTRRIQTYLSTSSWHTSSEGSKYWKDASTVLFKQTLTNKASSEHATESGRNKEVILWKHFLLLILVHTFATLLYGLGICILSILKKSVFHFKLIVCWWGAEGNISTIKFLFHYRNRISRMPILCNIFWKLSKVFKYRSWS